MQIHKVSLSLIILLMVSCKSTYYIEPWVDWTESNDSPGVEYRYFYSGTTFPRSSLLHWEVELYNRYAYPVEITVRLQNKDSLLSSVEVVKLASQSGTFVDLYHGLLPNPTEIAVAIEYVDTEFDLKVLN